MSAQGRGLGMRPAEQKKKAKRAGASGKGKKEPRKPMCPDYQTGACTEGQYQPQNPPPPNSKKIAVRR